MYYWRITKYDPKNRDINGIYLKDEWTDYSDIGKKFEDHILTEDEYLKTENAYITSVLLFMDCLDISLLQLVGLEYIGKNPTFVNIENVIIKNNEFYPKETIVFILRSILRNKFWCILRGMNGLCIKTDWDYYMFIQCPQRCNEAIAKIQALGLFVEPVQRIDLFDDEDENI